MSMIYITPKVTELTDALINASVEKFIVHVFDDTDGDKKIFLKFDESLKDRLEFAGFTHYTRREIEGIVKDANIEVSKLLPL